MAMRNTWQIIMAVVGAIAVITTGSGAACAQALNRCSGDAFLKHLVVIFDENVSFDHYFGTYPNAGNPPLDSNGKPEPQFHARPETPRVNGLLSAGLWTDNPNSTLPFRLDRSQAATSDQDHKYTEEQEGFDNGLMDLFPESTGSVKHGPDYGHGKGIVMGVFDGNTVTALWNYAQKFAMSDNSFGTTFGPSTPGALNLVTGRTGPVESANAMPPGDDVANPTDPTTGKGGAVIYDNDPLSDECSDPDHYQVRIEGPNIGDLLTADNVSWGWFQGGFRPVDPQNRKHKCSATHKNIGGYEIFDYIPHHEPFQYFDTTANFTHKPPSDVDLIGTNRDDANHQYDLGDFFAAVEHGHMPTVSFLKPAAYQDGHAGIEYESDPLDEQNFLVDTINRIEKTREWKETAIIVMWDDSDGWYDHVMGPIVNQSTTKFDSLSGAQSPREVVSPNRIASGMCGRSKSDAPSQGRCGYGPRLPLLVISPYAKVNFVDHSVTDQTSVIRYIEDRWLSGKRLGKGSTDKIAGSLCNMFDFTAKQPAPPIFLDRTTGQVLPPGVRTPGCR
jgi:phospholipase C